jgi:hypothetical protein
MTLWSDYSHIPGLAELGLQHLGEQQLPSALGRQRGESAPDWRDRLFHAFRIPSVYAALNELKSPYLEIASPLLVRLLVEQARSHPTHLRTGKKLFRDLTAEVGIPVAYADQHATANPDEALGHPAVLEVLSDEISSKRTRDILSSDFVSFVTGRMVQSSNRRRRSRYAPFKRVLESVLPKQVTAGLTRRPSWRTLSGKQLALRCYMISRMIERLQKDSQSIL